MTTLSRDGGSEPSESLLGEESPFRAYVRSWLESAMPEVWGMAEPPFDLEEEAEYEMRRRLGRVMLRDGWAGLSWPKTYGGQGFTLTQQLIFAEEAAAVGAPEAFNRVGLGIVGPALITHGTEEQRRAHLGAILADEEIWCQGFSEPNAGSDLASMVTTATREGDEWVFRGQKTWTTLARFADYCFLLARTSPAERHRGITAFIVSMNQPQVEVRPIRQINGADEFGDVFFDGARAPLDAVIGDVDGGWGVAMTALDFERSTNFINRQVRTLRDLEEVLASLRDHKDGVSEKLKQRAVEIYVRAEAFRHTLRAQVAKIEATGSAGIATNASKVYWSELTQDVASLALDVAGKSAIAGTSYDPLNPWVARYLWSRASSIYAGTNEIQRNIIAERGLGLPR